MVVRQADATHGPKYGSPGRLDPRRSTRRRLPVRVELDHGRRACGQSLLMRANSIG